MTPRKKKNSAEPAPVQLTDPRAIRALAHPARMAVIDELYSGGKELTATECAEIAGLSPSAMSYHLRSLEKAGIVERAESKGDARERPWRAAGSYLQVESGTGPSGIAAATALSETVLGRTLEQQRRWLERRSRESQEWIDAAGESYGQVWLLPEEAKQIEEGVLALVEHYRGRRGGDRPAGARRVRFVVMVFPSDEPKSDSTEP